MKKAYGMFAVIGVGIEYNSWDVLLQLYNTRVRPHFYSLISDRFGENGEKIHKDVAWIGEL